MFASPSVLDRLFSSCGMNVTQYHQGCSPLKLAYAFASVPSESSRLSNHKIRLSSFRDLALLY